MTRILPLALLLLAAAPAAAAERTYSVTDFDRVRVEGPYQVTLVTGLASGARAEGSTEALDRVAIDVEGGILRIRPNRSAWGGYPGDSAGPVKIALRTRELRTAAVVGSGGLDIDRVRGLRVDLSVSGNGRLNVAAIESDNLILGLLGGGRLTLAGRTKQLKASIQGSGDLAASALVADDALIAADTAGSIKVGVARTVKLTVDGPGDVEIVGNPSCTVEAKGSGQVLCGHSR
ncbi:MAG: GIN domain-containing protein [Allosphingosinicella sp.]